MKTGLGFGLLIAAVLIFFPARSAAAFCDKTVAEQIRFAKQECRRLAPALSNAQIVLPALPPEDRVRAEIVLIEAKQERSRLERELERQLEKERKTEKANGQLERQDCAQSADWFRSETFALQEAIAELESALFLNEGDLTSSTSARLDSDPSP